MGAVQAAMVFVLDESRRPLLDWAVIESFFSLLLRLARGCCPEQSMGGEGLPDINSSTFSAMRSANRS